jgi:hypothetical protein
VGQVTLYHGTDVGSALWFLDGGGLDTAAAASSKIDGPPGFFLATELDDAIFFGLRRRGTVIEFRITQDAFDQLMAAGSVLQPIPRGPKSPFFKGDELIVKPDSYSLFNILLRSGEITVKPSP